MSSYSSLGIAIMSFSVLVAIAIQEITLMSAIIKVSVNEKKVVYANPYPDTEALEFLKQANVEVVKFG